MKRTLTFVVVIGLLVAGTAWLARPSGLVTDSQLPALTAYAPRGERWFHLGGCATCHGGPGERDGEQGKLGGGLELATDFGSFLVPNISSDSEHGIGAWSLSEFVNAMRRGVAPDGRHYYPAFPYASYARMTLQDLADLKAYLDTLPPVRSGVGPHQLAFPWDQRWAIGLWKRLYLDDEPVTDLPADNPQALHGRYLVEGPGHCGECHTPRTLLGGLDNDRWLAGAVAADGEGRVPNITPHADGIPEWDLEDLSFYFKSGVDPDFDIVGGDMAAVQENLSRLDEADRAAIAAYLKAVEGRPRR